MINVLIADNNKQFSAKLLDALNRDDNIKVLNVVRDGQSAIVSYFDNPPDIFILELDLPKLNGLAVLDEIEYNIDEKGLCNVIIITENTTLKNMISDTSKIYKICNKNITTDELRKHIHELYSVNINKEQTDIKNQILEILLNLKFNHSNKSTQYIIEAVLIYYKHMNLFLKLNEVYEKVAIKCSTTPKKVKATIDSAIKNISDLLSENDILSILPYYDTSKGLTPKNLIIFIAELLETSETKKLLPLSQENNIAQNDTSIVTSQNMVTHNLPHGTPKTYPLRIDNTIMRKMKVISKYNGRSVNKEIEFVLKKYTQNIETEK